MPRGLVKAMDDEALGEDEAFAEASARRSVRFVAFLGADRLDVAAIGQPLLRQQGARTFRADGPVALTLPCWGVKMALTRFFVDRLF